MLSHPSLSKIQSDHLDRDALIYVRQSSLIQVRDNTASTMRQYDLVQRALSLGWTRERIHVIDQDQVVNAVPSEQVLPSDVSTCPPM